MEREDNMSDDINLFLPSENLKDSEDSDISEDILVLPSENIQEEQRFEETLVLPEESASTSVLYEENTVSIENRDIDDEDLGVGKDLFIEDEDLSLELDTEEIREERLGLNRDVISSVEEYLKVYGDALRKLAAIVSTTTPKLPYSELYKYLDLKDLPSNKQSKIINSLSLKDTNKIIKVYLETFKDTSNRELVELHSIVETAVARYEEFVNRLRLMEDIYKRANRNVLSRILPEIEKDLSYLAHEANRNNICYVDKIYLRPSGITYVCGNCSAKNESDRDFVRFIVCEALQEKDEYSALFPSGKTCSHCGKTNILTFDEHLKISSDYKSNYKEILERWGKTSNEKLSRTVNIIDYYPSIDEMTKYRSLYETVKEKVEHVQQEYVNYSLMNQWYYSTRELVEKLAIKLINDDPYEFRDGQFFINELGMYNSAYLTARVLCKLFNENYELLKQQALNSILLYFNDNSVLVSSLALERVYNYELISMYEQYLEADLESATFDVYESLCKQLGIKFEISEDGSVSSDTLVELKNKLSEIKSEYPKVVESREKAISLLYKVLPFFRFLEVRATKDVDIDNLKYVLVDARIKEWISRLVPLIIINKVADKFLSYWRVLQLGKFRNESIFNKASSKLFSERVDRFLKEYTNELNKLGAKDSPITKSREFLSRYYPESELLSVIRELKLALDDLDYYRFCKAFKYVDLSEFRATAFDGLKEFFDIMKNRVEDFVKNVIKEDSDFNYYKYHYGHLFSDEEIKEGLEYIRDRIKKNFLINREEGESFINYINRLKNSEYDPDKIIPVPGADKLADVYEYVPQLLGTFEYLKFTTNKDSHDLIFMNDIALYAYLYGGKYMYKVLGIDPPTEDMYRTIRSIDLPEYDENRLKIEFFLKNLIFPTVEANIIASGGDEEYPDIFAFAEREPELFMEQLKYFKDFQVFVNEHYISRVE